MTQDFLIYPSALEKIKEFGIEERVRKLRESEDGPGYISLERWSTAIFDIINSLKSEGYYKNLPPEFRPTYNSVMNGMIKEPEKYFWRVETSSGERKMPATMEDVDLFGGSVAALIFSPDEIWDFKKFGFSSASELVGLVSAYIINESHSDSHHGYIWPSQRKNSSTIVTEITGDSNADMRVFQEDITPYPSYDPFGNKVEFKKHMRVGGIFGYHSEEPSLMAVTLKYMDQLNLDIPFKKNGGKEILKWAEGIKEEEFVAATRFGSSFHAPLYFIGHPIPIPCLDETNSTNERCHDFIHCYGEGSYGAYISHDGNLVFASVGKDSIDNKIKDIRATFTPDDVEHIVKGLLYQSIKHLGRTSIYDLVELINHRFSPEFEIENERLKKEYGLK